jgi:hypothetical protein
MEDKNKRKNLDAELGKIHGGAEFRSGDTLPSVPTPPGGGMHSGEEELPPEGDKPSDVE